MMKRLFSFVWISDIHFSLPTIEVASTCLRQACGLAREKKLPVVISGDVNDTKSTIRSETVRALLAIHRDFRDLDFYYLVGNHDLESERSLEHHSLNFLKNLSNVRVIDTLLLMDEWAMIPYQNSSQKFLDQLEIVRGEGIKKIVCHQGFFGAKMGNYVVDQTSVSPLELKDFIFVASGHYHEHQHVGLGNIVYAGSPYTTSFAEADQRKFIHVVLDTEEGVKLESHPTDVRKHCSFDLHQDHYPPEKCPYFSSKDLLRVQLFGEKAWINSVSKDTLAQMFGTKNISVVPKPTKHQSQRMEIKNAFQVGEIVKQYVESAATDLSKDELMDFFSKELA